MIKTIVIEKVEDGVPPPTGNGFKVFSWDIFSGFPWMVDTGLSFTIPPDSVLRVESTDEWSVLGWKMEQRRLKIMVAGERQPEPGQHVATVWIDLRVHEPIRFMEHGPSGGRLIRGESESASCAENRDSKSGE